MRPQMPFSVPSVHLALCASAVLLLAIGAVHAAGLMSLAGVWELNVAKSRFTPGTEIKSQTRTYEVNGDQVKQSTDSVDNLGRQVHNHWLARYDGKDYPLEDNPD